MTDDNIPYGYVRNANGMLVQQDEEKIREELDDFVDYVLKYAKKHKLGYMMAICKHLPDDKNCAVMDSWWTTHNTDLSTMARMLVKGDGSVPESLLWAFNEELKERTAQKAKK